MMMPLVHTATRPCKKRQTDPARRLLKIFPAGAGRSVEPLLQPVSGNGREARRGVLKCPRVPAPQEALLDF